MFFEGFEKFLPCSLVLAQSERVGMRLAGISPYAQLELVYAERRKIGEALVEAVIAEDTAYHTDLHFP